MMTREERLDALCQLLPAQLDALVYRLDAPHHYLAAATAPQATRAVELLHWVDAANKAAHLDAEVARLASAPAVAVTPTVAVAPTAPNPNPAGPLPTLPNLSPTYDVDEYVEFVLLRAAEARGTNDIGFCLGHVGQILISNPHHTTALKLRDVLLEAKSTRHGIRIHPELSIDRSKRIYRHSPREIAMLIFFALLMIGFPVVCNSGSR